MTNYKLVLCYFGKYYSGSQYQPGKRTVEGDLKGVAKKVFKKPFSLTLSGRTDSGVHALGQVCNVKVDSSIKAENVKLAFNRYLNEYLNVISVEIKDSDFNAQFSAKKRTYRYCFYSKRPPIYLRDFMTKINFNFDENKMDIFSQYLLGEKDFINFRNSGSFTSSTIRTIYEFKFTKKYEKSIYDEFYEYYELEISANGFLYRMVRNLVGAIFEVLQDKKSFKEFELLTENKIDKKEYKYTTAKPEGLCLINITY